MPNQMRGSTANMGGPTTHRPGSTKEKRGCADMLRGLQGPFYRSPQDFLPITHKREKQLADAAARAGPDESGVGLDQALAEAGRLCSA
jgi:hypothetical protein